MSAHPLAKHLHAQQLDPVVIKAVEQAFQVQTVSRKAQLLRPGDTASHLYYVETGGLRVYYEKLGKDLSGYFFLENGFAGAYDSFITQQPSRQGLEAMEESTLWGISYPAFQQLLNTHPVLNRWIRVLLEERFVALHALYAAHLLDSPAERYRWLCDTRPELLQRVPQHQLATFLGITPVSLSRIRRRQQAVEGGL